MLRSACFIKQLPAGPSVRRLLGSKTLLDCIKNQIKSHVRMCEKDPVLRCRAELTPACWEGVRSQILSLGIVTLMCGSVWEQTGAVMRPK